MTRTQLTLAIYKHLHERSGERFTTKQVASLFKISHDTAMRALHDLLDSKAFPLVQDGGYWYMATHLVQPKEEKKVPVMQKSRLSFF